MTWNRVKTIGQDGLLRNNPTFRLVLGTCPTLALTTLAFNGIGMGLAVTFVLICSNVIISALRKVIPNEVRIPAFVLIIATFVTLLRMLLDKLVPSLYESMGVYLPLIVVNCIILGRAESFASKRPVLESALDGLFTGLGFTWALTFMGVIREVLGAGSLFGIKLWDFQIGFFSSSAGAFFVYGLCIALFNFIYTKVESVMHKKNFVKTYLTPGNAQESAETTAVQTDAPVAEAAMQASAQVAQAATSEAPQADMAAKEE